MRPFYFHKPKFKLMTFQTKKNLPFFLIVLLIACSDKKTQQTETTEGVATEEIVVVENTDTVMVNDETKAHVSDLLNQYYDLQSALVGNDIEKAKSAGEKMYEMIASFDIASLQDNIATGYKDIANKIQNNAQVISEVEDIEVQREHFASITDGMYKMVKTYDANEEAVYYTHCPMAFDNNGGYWLSKDKEIKNPYFGSKMLKCGSVKETIAEN